MFVWHPPVLDSRVERLLGMFGVDPSKRRPLDFGRGWECYGVQRADGTDPHMQVILAASGPKNLAELKKAITADCVVVFVPKNALFLRALGESCSVVVESGDDYERVGAVLQSCNFPGAKFKRVHRGRPQGHRVHTRIRDARNRQPRRLFQPLPQEPDLGRHPA